ncbi:MAG: riboflavin biosynthesis protein RibF [Verrucomicrobiota bacterium]
MLTCRSLEDLARQPGPLHLALGVFDGVHAGHQEVLRRAVEAARLRGGTAGLVTFDPHPISVIAPGKAPSSLLSSLDHKAEIVRDLGIGLFVPLPFDEAMARMEAQKFLARLLRAPIATIAIGEDWRFGHNRAGDVEMLRAAAAEHAFRLEAVAPVMLDGDRISSTRIRQAIRDGNLADAARMLGRPYSISGPVVHGRKLGRTIGFPTANVSIEHHQLPPPGVWEVTVDVEDFGRFTGAANLGGRPTMGSDDLALEVHLLDFDGELYGKRLDVEFVRHLRGVKRFSGPDELAAAILNDIAEIRRGISGGRA